MSGNVEETQSIESEVHETHYQESHFHQEFETEVDVQIKTEEQQEMYVEVESEAEAEELIQSGKLYNGLLKSFFR